MIREGYLALINNYVGLIFEGLYNKSKVLYIALVLLLSIGFLGVAWIASNAAFVILAIYSVLLIITPQIWRRKSLNLGLKSLVIYPGSRFWLGKMLRARNINIPVQKTIEIHVNVKQKYKNWDEYNTALDMDIDKIISHLKSDKFGTNVTVTFNSFNRRITDKLEMAFQGRGARFKEITLPGLIIYTYLPDRFKEMQINMFGEVKSKRPVHVPEAWELLIYNHKGGTINQ